MALKWPGFARSAQKKLVTCFSLSFNAGFFIQDTNTWPAHSKARISNVFRSFWFDFSRCERKERAPSGYNMKIFGADKCENHPMTDTSTGSRRKVHLRLTQWVYLILTKKTSCASRCTLILRCFCAHLKVENSQTDRLGIYLWTHYDLIYERLKENSGNYR